MNKIILCNVAIFLSMLNTKQLLEQVEIEVKFFVLMILKQVQQNIKTNRTMIINLLYDFQIYIEFSVLRTSFSVFEKRSNAIEFSVSAIKFSEK